MATEIPNPLLEGQTITIPPTPTTWALGPSFAHPLPHHASLRALWETKWSPACQNATYPFHDSNGFFDSFKKIFHSLIAQGIEDGYGDEYTYAFFPEAQRLGKLAESAFARTDAMMGAGDVGQEERKVMREEAEREGQRFALAAAAVYRIARFPYLDISDAKRKGVKWMAWERQKSVYELAASRWVNPVMEVMLPVAQIFPDDSAGLETMVPAYLRLSPAAAKGGKSPTVILLTGLDGHRPDNTLRLHNFHTRGWTSLTVEIPGTADCPIPASDSSSNEVLLNAVFRFLHLQPWFDHSLVAAWGLSAGGYHAVRGAHTHSDQFRGVVAQGAGVHWWFDREWMDGSEVREYPFPLLRALAVKFGYGSVEEYKEEAMQKWSLLNCGILDTGTGSCRLLLVNGTMDGLMPIEDSWLCFERGNSKEGKFVGGRMHMGYPEANGFVYPWLEGLLGVVKVESGEEEKDGK